MSNKRRPVKQTSQVEAEKGFIARWMRRKASANASQQRCDETATRSSSDAVAGPSPPGKTDAEMPPLEGLNENSDFSVFFSSKVSDRLRRLALRKLFHMPAFNLTDGLDDYAEDYHGFSELGEIVTADMRHQLQRLKAEARKKRPEKPSKPRARRSAAGPTAGTDNAEHREVAETRPGDAKTDHRRSQG